jgi:hypothetical protein
MSNATKMLIVLFNGRTIHEAARAEICRTLGELCEATSVEMMELNARELAIVAAKPIAEQLQVEEKKTSGVDVKTPEDEAIVYIGNVMKEELSKPKFDPIDFIDVLLHKARDSKNGADNRALLNAMFILSQDQLHVSESLMKEYNMTPYKVKLIKRCYSIICKA